MKISFCSLLLLGNAGTIAYASEDFPILMTRKDGNMSEAGVCGAMCEAADQYPYGLYHCLYKSFGDAAPVMLSKERTLPKVVFSPATSLEEFSLADLKDYNQARHSFLGSRLPAVVLYAEDDQDVINGINCARENGYVVSPRGRGHAYQALSTYDGSLVIDLSLNCKIEDITIDKNDTGEHILPGSKYISTIEVPAGCTNAVLLAANADLHDRDEGAMVVIGSCPSVGVIGYILGGGYGDQTPYMGLALDVVTSMDVVLYNGTLVTASRKENEDLFWASRGGGGGFGVITRITVKNVQSPNPTAFTFTGLTSSAGNIDALVEWMDHVQNYLQDDPDGPRFGGSWNPANKLIGIFLGSWEETIASFSKAGLANKDAMEQTISTSIRKHGNVICDNDDGASPSCDELELDIIPQHGLVLVEVETQAEVEAIQICKVWFTPDYLSLGNGIVGTARTNNICEDLGIDISFCNFEPPTLAPNILEDGQVCANKSSIADIILCLMNALPNDACYDPVVIDATIAAARDPKSFLNVHGPSNDGAAVLTLAKLSQNVPQLGSLNTMTGVGGMTLPRLASATLRKLAEGTWPSFDHLSHGASVAVDVSDAAYAHRDGVYCIGPPYQYGPDQPIDVILTDPYYNNDPKKLMGYYPYMGSARIPNWREYYFGDHVVRLSATRSKYDPFGGFNMPMYVEGGINYKEAKGGKKGKAVKAGKKAHIIT